MALAEALTIAPVEAALSRYNAVRRPSSLAPVEESRRLGAYLERKAERTADPAAFMRENRGVEPSSVDGGLFYRLIEQAKNAGKPSGRTF